MQKAVGDDCRVQDPLYHITFDLAQLELATSSQSVTAGNYTYLLNVCGPLHGAPEHCQGENVGACQTKPGGFAKDAGMESL